MTDTATPARGSRAGSLMDPQELKARVSAGLLSFPVTYFTPSGDFDPEPYRAPIGRPAEPRPAVRPGPLPRAVGRRRPRALPRLDRPRGRARARGPVRGGRHRRVLLDHA